ncbi:MAG: membrane dipeptidase [Clostridiales bacterium]|nr:membrane dipeptidase [Clostridiales bacterium]
MIFDLHNDLATSTLSASEQSLRLHDTAQTIFAFWSTELSDPFSFIESKISAFGNALFAVEDLWFITEDTLPRLCALPLTYCGLTHNKRNSLAGGALEDAHLTPLGAKTVASLERAGIVLDTAHLGKKSFYDVLDSTNHVINSHTGLSSVCAHPRNLDFDQVREILARGGIVGLTAVKDFIGGDTVGDYVHLIDTFVQTFGVDGACIGTDFYGTEPLQGLRTYDDFADVHYKLSNLGYTDSDIRKIFYQNANDYFLNRREK